MNNALFEQLLYEEENVTLDFKVKQYLFAKASEDDKSELLKDILGFANAWRRSEAYVLIGVKEQRGGRSQVIGIEDADHLDDHSLQQFVNNLTSRPVQFHYEAFEFEGKQIGIIRIEEQTRPIYLKRNYGSLLKDAVYVRRGSSTDPTKPASLDEVARMGAGSSEGSCELVVEFAEVTREHSLGTSLSWEAEYCDTPEKEDIPDYRQPGRTGHFGFELRDPLNSVNSGYYRELAEFEFTRRLFRPIRLLVKNVGHTGARNVQLDLSVPRDSGMAVIDGSDFPSPPRRMINRLYLPDVARLTTRFRRIPGEVAISQDEERLRIEIECGDLQPGRRVWSETLYIGIRESGLAALRGCIFADNLPKPKEFVLTIAAEVEHKVLSVHDLVAL